MFDTCNERARDASVTSFIMDWKIAGAGLLLSVAACSSSSSGGGTPPEDAATPEPDAAGDASTPPVDASTPVDSTTPATDGGLPLGSMCTQASDCASGLCEPFRMQTVHMCTQPCTTATQATDCPNPPTAGTCTPNMYCRFN
jgi:hypothetical protein